MAKHKKLIQLVQKTMAMRVSGVGHAFKLCNAMLKRSDQSSETMQTRGKRVNAHMRLCRAFQSVFGKVLNGSDQPSSARRVRAERRGHGSRCRYGTPLNHSQLHKKFFPRCYLGSMRCFLGSGQKAMQAMLSISRTYENTADYKIQTRSERSFADAKGALAYWTRCLEGTKRVSHRPASFARTSLSFLAAAIFSFC